MERMNHKCDVEVKSFVLLFVVRLGLGFPVEVKSNN